MHFVLFTCMFCLPVFFWFCLPVHCLSCCLCIVCPVYLCVLSSLPVLFCCCCLPVCFLSWLLACSFCHVYVCVFGPVYLCVFGPVLSVYLCVFPCLPTCSVYLCVLSCLPVCSVLFTCMLWSAVSLCCTALQFCPVYLHVLSCLPVVYLHVLSCLPVCSSCLPACFVLFTCVFCSSCLPACFVLFTCVFCSSWPACFVLFTCVLWFAVCVCFRALQFPPEAWLRISLAHASLTHIMIRPSGRVILRCLGNAGHLPPTKVTFSWLRAMRGGAVGSWAGSGRSDWSALLMALVWVVIQETSRRRETR